MSSMTLASATRFFAFAATAVLLSTAGCKKKTPAEKLGDKVEDIGDKIEDKTDEAD